MHAPSEKLANHKCSCAEHAQEIAAVKRELASMRRELDRITRQGALTVEPHTLGYMG